MPAAAQNLPSSIPQDGTFSILLVSQCDKDGAELQRILGAPVRRQSTVRDALPELKSAAVVVCERDLPDGTWQTLLDQCGRLANPPLFTVVSAQADESLWAEVLNLGGYDVLMKPFEADEVSRVIGLCGRRWLGRNVITDPTRQPVGSAVGSLQQLSTRLA